MRKPPRLLTALVALPFLVGCTGLVAQQVPDTAARPTTPIRGVVLDSGERVEYDSTESVEWTDSSLTIIGAIRGELGNISSRTFQLREVDSVLVHQVDPNRTSLLVAGVMTGLGVLAAVLFTGTTADGTILRGEGG